MWTATFSPPSIRWPLPAADIDWYWWDWIYPENEAFLVWAEYLSLPPPFYSNTLWDLCNIGGIFQRFATAVSTVQYLHWSIKHLLILLLLCTMHWRCLLKHCSISYLVSCIVHNSAGVFMFSRSLYRYCILILYRNIVLKYCTQNIVLKILNMVHVYSKVWIFMFSRRLYSRYWSQRISSQLLLSQI